MRTIPAARKPACLDIKHRPKVWLWPAICALIILSTASLPGREVRSPEAIYEGGGFDLNVKIQIVFWMCVFFVAITWAIIRIPALETVRTLWNLKVVRWTGLFLLVSALSTLWSVSFTLTLFRAMQLFTMLIIIVWLIRTKQTSQHILAGLYWTIAVFGVLSVVGLIFWPDARHMILGGIRTETIRLGGPFYSPGVVGETVAIIFIGLFCRAMSSRGSARRLLFLASAIAFVIVVGTRSRTALVMIFLVFLTLLTARKAGIGILAILAIVFFGLLLSLGIGFYAVDTLNRGDDFRKIWTLNNRTLVWVETLEIAFEKPWLGRGYVAGNRDILREQIAQKGMGIGGYHAHNAVLAAFIDTGIIGAFLVAAFYLEMLVIVFRNMLEIQRTKKNFWARGEICGVGIAIVVQGIPACGVAGKVSPQVVFALLTALAIARATHIFGLGIKDSNNIIKHIQ